MTLFEVKLFAPFLKQAHALTPAVGSPQVASARGIVAAILVLMVAVTSSSDARSSEKIDDRRTSAKKLNL